MVTADLWFFYRGTDDLTHVRRFGRWKDFGCPTWVSGCDTFNPPEKLVDNPGSVTCLLCLHATGFLST